jgi:hypothetical protein
MLAGVQDDAVVDVDDEEDPADQCRALGYLLTTNDLALYPE